MRLWNPEHTYFVTNRCEQERLLLLPTPEVLRLIGAWLAKALAEHGDGVELYAFVFLSNHFHMLVRDPKGQLPRVMWFFQLNLAKAVNFHLGRRGHFFARKYDAAPVLTDEDFEDRYAYILTNAVKAGLVARAADGPFFSSLQMALDGEPRSFVWTDNTLRHIRTRRGQRRAGAEFERRYTLSLSVPPAWRGWSAARRRRRVAGLVAANEARYGKARRAEGQGVLGARRILAQSPRMRPVAASFSPRVKVFCRDEALAAAYEEAFGRVKAAYRRMLRAAERASGAGRRSLVEWPPGTYPPSSMVPVPAAA